MIENKCFITYQFKTGGVEKLFLNISKEYKNNIYLITIYPNSDEYINSIPSNVTTFNCPTFIKKLHYKPIQFIIYLLYLFLITQTNKDYRELTFINFSDTLSTLFATWFLSIGHKKKYSWIQLNPRVLSQSRFYRIYSNLYKRMDKVICICDAQRELFHKIFADTPKDLTTVIYNGIIPKQIDIMKLAALEKKYSDEKFILMVARLDMRSKDFYTVIDAFHQNKEISENYKLFFLGDGPDRIHIENYIKSKGLTNKVILLGQDINPYRWMYNANLYIHSSKAEGFGLVIIEAMQCGVPVIATDCEVGPKEILNDNEYGITVPVCNPAAMSLAMSNILNNSELASHYRNKSIQRAKKYYINESIIKIKAL